MWISARRRGFAICSRSRRSILRVFHVARWNCRENNTLNSTSYDVFHSGVQRVAVDDQGVRAAATDRALSIVIVYGHRSRRGRDE